MVLTALALFDPDQHAITVDITVLQMRELARPLPATIGHAERRTILQAGPWGRLQNASNSSADGCDLTRHALQETGPPKATPPCL